METDRLHSSAEVADEMNEEPAAQSWTGPGRLEFNDVERRILGVLIEKGLTHPKSYPLSMSALLSGCNQRSNRDPVSQYDETLLEDALARLQARQFVTMFYPGEGGRVHRWRQDLGKVFELRGVELAVIAELFLRGAQSAGELRQRASRMREIPSLEELDRLLQKLIDLKPPFVVRLTPEGVSRGVRYTHACYEEGEMQRVLEEEARPLSRVAAPGPAPRSGELGDLKLRVDDLEARIARLEAALGGPDEGDHRERPASSEPADPGIG